MTTGEILEYAPSPGQEDTFRAEAKERVKEYVREIAQGWKDAIESAWQDKQDKFGDDAEEAMKFFGSDHSFIWDSLGKTDAGKALKSAPGFAMTYNVVAELVQIFGPFIYHRNPDRQADARRPIQFPREAIVDPVLEHQLKVMSTKLNDAIIQKSQPFVQQLVENGVDENAAQQQAYQAAAMMPEFVEPQRKMAEMDAALREQMELFDDLGANQIKSSANNTTRSMIMAAILNYTPEELNLRDNSRRVVDEAIIKGEGIWWTELVEGKEDDRVLVGSFYDSIDNFLVQSGICNYEEANWVARRRAYPKWKARERWPNAKFKDYSSTKSNSQKKKSKSSKADADGAFGFPGDSEMLEDTTDYYVVWEIYSKMGIGSRLNGVSEEIEGKLSGFGDYCFIEVSDCCDEPLNFTCDALFNKDPDELFMEVQWPIPFWKDGEYPCTPLSFHWVPNSPWGMSHIKPGMGELKFLDYIMSHLARKIKAASTDIIGVLASAEKEIKDALEDDGLYDESNGYRIIPIQSHFGKSVADMFSVMQRPAFNSSIWDVVTAVAARLDRRLGLNDKAFGMGGTESRSAADSKNKQAAFSIRPEDMANVVEEKATILARKEAMAIAFFMDRDDVAPIIGEEAAFLYEKLIYNQDPIAIVREFDYKIKANSIRRPSRETDQENMTMLTQIALPGMFNYAGSTNDYGPLNWYFQQLGSAFNMNTDGCRFSPAVPPPPPQPTQEELQVLAVNREIAETNLKAQLQQAKNIENEMRLAEIRALSRSEITSLDVQKKRAMLEMDYEKHVQEMEQRIEAAAVQRRIDQAEHDQEMAQDAEAFEVTAKGVEEGKTMMPSYRRAEQGFR